MSDQFEAKGPMLGYFFQPIYALYLLLKNDSFQNPNTKIFIENLDDIDFINSDNQLKLIQTKHHINKQGSISDRSDDLWKSLRIWVDRIDNGKIENLSECFFVLTTTVKASSNCIAKDLKIDKEFRNTKNALKELRLIAQEGYEAKEKRLTDRQIKKHKNEDAYLAFYHLNEEIQDTLVSKIYVVDDSPDISQVQEEVKRQLGYACELQDKDYFLEKLLGWWFYKVIKNLNAEKNIPITHFELDEKISQIREEFKHDCLPIDFEHEFNDITESNLSEGEKKFLEQLNILGASNICIGNAIRDYYRAYSQKCKWTREGKILDESFYEDYDKRLINEWIRFFDQMHDEINDFGDEKELQRAGKDLYRRIEQNNLPICDNPVHSNKGFYIMRGFYHMLANELKVGWHPEFNKRLCHLHPDYIDGKCFIDGFKNKICDLMLDASRAI